MIEDRETQDIPSETPAIMDAALLASGSGQPEPEPEQRAPSEQSQPVPAPAPPLPPPPPSAPAPVAAATVPKKPDSSPIVRFGFPMYDDLPGNLIFAAKAREFNGVFSAAAPDSKIREDIIDYFHTNFIFLQGNLTRSDRKLTVEEARKKVIKTLLDPPKEVSPPKKEELRAPKKQVKPPPPPLPPPEPFDPGHRLIVRCGGLKYRHLPGNLAYIEACKNARGDFLNASRNSEERASIIDKFHARFVFLHGDTNRELTAEESELRLTKTLGDARNESRGNRKPPPKEPPIDAPVAIRRTTRTPTMAPLYPGEASITGASVGTSTRESSKPDNGSPPDAAAADSAPAYQHLPSGNEIVICGPSKSNRSLPGNMAYVKEATALRSAYLNSGLNSQERERIVARFHLRFTFVDEQSNEPLTAHQSRQKIVKSLGDSRKETTEGPSAPKQITVRCGQGFNNAKYPGNLAYIAEMNNLRDEYLASGAHSEERKEIIEDVLARFVFKHADTNRSLSNAEAREKITKALAKVPAGKSKAKGRRNAVQQKVPSSISSSGGSESEDEEKQIVHCGQAYNNSRYPGTVAFNEEIAELAGDYAAADSHGGQRRKIAEGVLARFTFIRGDSNVELTEKEAIDKICGALRYAANRETTQTKAAASKKQLVRCGQGFNSDRYPGNLAYLEATDELRDQYLSSEPLSERRKSLVDDCLTRFSFVDGETNRPLPESQARSKVIKSLGTFRKTDRRNAPISAPRNVSSGPKTARRSAKKVVVRFGQGINRFNSKQFPGHLEYVEAMSELRDEYLNAEPKSQVRDDLVDEIVSRFTFVQHETNKELTEDEARAKVAKSLGDTRLVVGSRPSISTVAASRHITPASTTKKMIVRYGAGVNRVNSKQYPGNPEYFDAMDALRGHYLKTEVGSDEREAMVDQILDRFTFVNIHTNKTLSESQARIKVSASLADDRLKSIPSPSAKKKKKTEIQQNPPTVIATEGLDGTVVHCGSGLNGHNVSQYPGNVAYIEAMNEVRGDYLKAEPGSEERSNFVDQILGRFTFVRDGKALSEAEARDKVSKSLRNSRMLDVRPLTFSTKKKSTLSNKPVVRCGPGLNKHNTNRHPGNVAYVEAMNELRADYQSAEPHGQEREDMINQILDQFTFVHGTTNEIISETQAREKVSKSLGDVRLVETPRRSPSPKKKNGKVLVLCGQGYNTTEYPGNLAYLEEMVEFRGDFLDAENNSVEREIMIEHFLARYEFVRGNSNKRLSEDEAKDKILSSLRNRQMKRKKASATANDLKRRLENYGKDGDSNYKRARLN